MTGPSRGSRHVERLSGEVAGCQVRLELPEREAPWQEPLQGTIYLSGGAKPTVLRVRAGIEVCAGEAGYTGIELLPSRTWEDVEVPTGEQVRLCFGFRMPWGSLFQPMQVQVAVRAGWRHVARLSAAIFVVPPTSFRRIARVLEELTGCEGGPWRASGAGDSAATGFVPPQGAVNRFEAVHLEVFRNNGVVYGTVTVDPAVRSMLGALRTLMEFDRETLSFRFAESEIHQARTVLAQLLRRYLDDTHRLPIPSTNPEPRLDNLPLAAEGETYEPRAG